MEEQKKVYQVVVTQPAKDAFFEILEYLLEQYSYERAEEISNELNNLVNSLVSQPYRGSKELRLISRINDYRFLLYKRSNRADIKIIYFIDKQKELVYITDFFPTEKDDQKIN